MDEEIRRAIEACPCPKCGGAIKATDESTAICQRCSTILPIRHNPPARRAGVAGANVKMTVTRKDGRIEREALGDE